MESSIVKITEKPMMRGTAIVSSITKRLLGADLKGAIAVINHEDLDETAAEGLLASQAVAVINASRTMSGTYPARGSLLLLSANIPIFEIDSRDFLHFQNGMNLEIFEDRIETGLSRVAYRPFDERQWLMMYRQAQLKLDKLLSDFIDNTLEYASREKKLILSRLPIPPLTTELAGRHTLIVARGCGYRQDLAAIHTYIKERSPVMIGVDGGADALIEEGFTPQMIIGDMDSVSDRALTCGAELVVHAYLDGQAPGLKRLRRLGLQAHVIPAVGTSEDVAMQLADQSKAELIITIGTRTHMIDFLEKGRKGMGSTLLTRLKLGAKLIDAKGVQTFYK
jgi:uncharacterized membrane-anchored protein